MVFISFSLVINIISKIVIYWDLRVLAIKSGAELLM